MTMPTPERSGSDDNGGTSGGRVVRRHDTRDYINLDQIAAAAEPRPMAQLFLRLIWFVVAGGVGFLWIYSEQITSRPLPVHAHLVFFALFLVALASGGYDLRAFILWRRELARLGENPDIPPKYLADASALLAAMIEQRPEALRAARKEIEK